ncbi:MAG: hypothetical protein HQ558_06900 [Candidatus Omnitrophica bacterium]|nr:hypothetical protein [Candidatus Omnitrophota bacterium]
MTILAKISLIAAVVLPLWNMPLIMRIIQRRSSEDISIWWAIGVWTCLLLMLPHGLVTEEVVFRWFTIVNFVIFSLAASVVIIFHKKR